MEKNLKMSENVTLFRRKSVMHPYLLLFQENELNDHACASANQYVSK